jgi:transcriptional regulator with XRE-family HTH domain
VRTLKELRESKGMTQHDVARKLDVTDVAVSRWECGRSNPLFKYRERLAALYGVPLNTVNKLLTCEDCNK